MSLTVGSLFAGIGGFDLAAERVAMTVAWQAEIEPFPSAVLAHRFNAPNLGDVTAISNPPPVDIVTFGSPCQDLSVAGRRAGLEGARSGLFFEATRLIRVCRPVLAIWENVPGAQSSRDGRDFLAALDALAECGALDIGWRILDAQFFGIPQRRRRVFVVCDFAGRRAAQILALSEGGGGHPATGRAEGADVAHPVRASTGSGGLGGHQGWNTTYAIQDGRGLDKDQNGLGVSDGDVAYTLDGVGAQAVAHALTSHHGDHDASGETFVASPLTASNGHHGHSSPRGDGGDNLVVAAPIAFFHEDQRTGAVYENDHSHALSAGGGGKPGQGYQAIRTPMGVRRLTPVECERLQGFPDGWTCLQDHPQPCDCPDAPRYRALGNAVAVPVAEWLLRRVMAALS